MERSLVILCSILFLMVGLVSLVSGSATLEPAISATVNEGRELQVCVSLDPPATGNTVVTVATSVETATAGVDFTPLDEDIMFTLGEMRRCTSANISIQTDNIVESVETFNIRISSNDVPISPISTIATRVNIADRSRITVAFTASDYTTPNENDAFSEVCAMITDGTIDRDVTFSITSVSGGTATALDDFNIIPASIMPPRFSPDPANNNPCIQINLVNDNLVEEDEYFLVRLSGGNEAIDVLADTAQVVITDDDGATVQISQSSLVSVQEGNSGNTTVNMCVDLMDAMGGLQRNVVINISTQDRTAMASDNDYFPIQNQPLTILSSTPVGGQVCTPIIVIGDEIRESSELFQVTFTATDDNDVVPAVFRITIADDGDVLVTCPDLNNPQNGQVMVNDVNNIQGANATYSCNTGFELVGNSMRDCQNTGGSIGVWSGSDPTCQSIDCDSPPELGNSTVQYTTTTFGSTAVYTCDPGYELSTGTSTFTRQCLETAQWTEATPSCNIVDCGQPPSMTNGQISAPMTTFQSTATYTCDMGYEFPSGAQQITRTCQANSLWSNSTPICQAVDCGQPPSVVNGQVSAPETTFQSTATYSCDLGYEFSSGAHEITRMCQANMEWSDSTPVCQPVNCGSPPSTTNGQVNAPSTALNSQATYQCDPGYEFESGSPEVTRMCQANGTWSGTTPACNAVNCGQPPVVADGQVTASATTFQSTASYECDRGFEFPLGETTSVQCQADGTWSAPTPTCQSIMCEELSNPENGTVSPLTERIVDSIATYSCNDGFELVGTPSVICQLNGTWSAEEPSCVVVCEDLSLNNGNVEQNNGKREGSVATHTCNEGFMLSGDAIRICQSNGEWTGSRLSCLQNPTVPPTEGLSSLNTDSVAIGASVAAGIIILILIFAGGFMCLACILIRKKKVYKKYVLPYRTYMYANNSVRNNRDGIIPDNDIRQWENDTQTHTLAAVEALDK